MGNHMFRKRISAGVMAIAIASILAACSGCKHRVSSATGDGSDADKPTPATQFERDLQFVRNSQYTYVWVFSRKDGKPFDKEDGDYLRKYAPEVFDWVRTDDGKRFIAGTNFDLDAANWELLKKRFVVEDYSGK